MKRSLTILTLMLVALVCAVLWLREDGGVAEMGNGRLVVHCAAGLRKPMTEIARRYEEEFGVEVNLQFGGSGALESQLEVAGGDLYLPADVSYLESTREKGLLEESMPVARLTAGLVVRKGNPEGLRVLADLGRVGLKVSLAERSASVGKHTWGTIEEAGLLGKIKPQVVVTKPTVNNIIEDVATGAVDATLAWDAVAANFEEVEWIELREFSKRARRAGIGVLSSTKDVTRSLHFARYVSARDRGREVFREMGFSVPETGDLWADLPTVTLYSGSMLRPAIQERVREFERREGCRVDTVFEGCGTLVAMMIDGGGNPAGYFSCDRKFLTMVEDRFEKGVVVSGNEIVLIVEKGNPKNVKSLEDLKKQGVRVGICDPRKSALGELTRAMLERRLGNSELGANMVVMAGKGDDLVNAMQARSLDVALVYRSNALASPATMKECEIVSIGDDLAFASQPFAVSRSTEHPELMRRLGDYLSHTDARLKFEKLGFTWKLQK